MPIATISASRFLDSPARASTPRRLPTAALRAVSRPPTAFSDGQPRRLLVVDDSEDCALAITSALQHDSLQLDFARSFDHALARLRERSYHVAIINAELPGQSGLRLLTLLRAKSPSCACLAITTAPTVSSAVAALKAGAADFLVLPLPPETLRQKAYDLLAGAPTLSISSLVATERSPAGGAGVVGATPVMQQLFARLETAAHKSTPVLITGEPGTGKDLLARALSQLGRRLGPPVTLHPAVLPAEELMLQLFGQERIGRNGEPDITMGLLERAHGGTLLIDEVEKLDAGGQRCLRQILTDPVYCRRGSAELRTADVRIIAMTSRPLLELVQRGQFCETLFHLLTATWLDVPPLRQRREDIPLLAAAFLAQSASRARTLPPATLLRLRGHGWPGNVRELRAVLAQASEQAQGTVIAPAHIDKLLTHPRSGSATTFQPGTTLAAVQREVILMTLAAVDGNKKDAAALLGLSRGALYNHLRTYHAQAQAEWRAAQHRLVP